MDPRDPASSVSVYISAVKVSSTKICLGLKVMGVHGYSFSQSRKAFELEGQYWEVRSVYLWRREVVKLSTIQHEAKEESLRE